MCAMLKASAMVAVIAVVACGPLAAQPRSTTAQSSASPTQHYVVRAYPLRVYIPSSASPFNGARTSVFVLRHHEWAVWRRHFRPSQYYYMEGEFALPGNLGHISVGNNEVGIVVISRAVLFDDGPPELVLNSVSCDSHELSLAFTDIYPIPAMIGRTAGPADGGPRAGVEARAWLIVVPMEAASFHWAASNVRGFGDVGRALAVSMTHKPRDEAANDGWIERFETTIHCPE